MIGEERFYAGIRESTARLAGIVTDEDETRPVPTCPDWTLRQLATHVGRAQRWAAEIVTRRSPAFIAFRDVPGGRIPDDPAQRPDWLNAGASLLIDSVRAGGAERVWTHFGIGPAGYWARRMAHETAVHLADAELAVGRDVRIAADLAADGIDEWLGFAAAGQGDQPPPLPAEGQTLHVHVTADAPEGAGWSPARRTGWPSSTATPRPTSPSAVRPPRCSSC